MARMFTTAMGLLIMFTIAAFTLSEMARGADVGEKDAFNMCVGLAAAWFALGMVFIGRMRARGNDWFTPVNLNVLLAALAGVLLLIQAARLYFGEAGLHGEGAGVLIGGAMTSFVGAGSSLTMALARRDDEEPPE